MLRWLLAIMVICNYFAKQLLTLLIAHSCQLLLLRSENKRVCVVFLNVLLVLVEIVVLKQQLTLQLFVRFDSNDLLQWQSELLKIRE